MSPGRRFTGRGANEAFTCAQCGQPVPPLDNGSYRDHCPHCLYSLHVDVFPGDRANECGGLLEPIGASHHANKGWVIHYRCTRPRCGATCRNKAALDDVVPDDYDRIIGLTLGS